MEHIIIQCMLHQYHMLWLWFEEQTKHVKGGEVYIVAPSEDISDEEVEIAIEEVVQALKGD